MADDITFRKYNSTLDLLNQIEKLMSEACSYLKENEGPHIAFVFAAIEADEAGTAQYVKAFCGGNREEVDFLLDGLRQRHLMGDN